MTRLLSSNGLVFRAMALLAALQAGSLARAEIVFLGKAEVPGYLSDTSGLTGDLTNPITLATAPHNQLGGFGSAISHIRDNLFIATPDRGPFDGTVPFLDRSYQFAIQVKPGAAIPVTASLVSTTLLKNENGVNLTGFSGAFDATNSPASLRFDPEGVRMANDGRHYYVSDEYGPFVYKFDSDGNRVQVYDVGAKFHIAHPNADGAAEITDNLIDGGRQTNRGMEGLAISPDGTKLYGIMQSPLIQDHGLTGTTRDGTNVRMVEIDVATGATREFLYQMTAGSNGISEIVAVNDHEFLVVERDGRIGSAALVKNIVKIDIAGATDIKNIAELPKTGTPPGVVPVTHDLFLNMLDPAFGLAGPNFPEKIEGLAWGDDLSDGRHVLLITSDNDLSAANPTRIYAFAIDDASLPNYVAQQVVPEPATSVLLLTGLAAFGLVRLRRHRASAA